MAEKLTNEEVVKVLGGYLNCEVEFEKELSDPNKIGSGKVRRRIRYYDLDERIVENIKLLITPISAITDEHAIEVADILKYKSEEYFKENLGYSRIDAVKMLLLEKGNYMGQICNILHSYEYLKSKGYDVPLWFGINHWANGKTAIELGIAIDKNKTKDQL